MKRPGRFTTLIVYQMEVGQNQVKQEYNPTRRQLEMEREWSELYVDTFDMKNSKSYNYFKARFGKCPGINELQSIAIITSHYTEVPIYREYYRKKKAIILWFETNSDILLPWVDNHLIAFDSRNREYKIKAS